MKHRNPGQWSAYKKLVKKPAQIEGRNQLRKAINSAVVALNKMWESERKSEKKITGEDICAKYSYAAYYIFKYLAETKEFDPIAELHGYIIHMIWQRENGNWILVDNNNAETLNDRIAEFIIHVGQLMIDLYKRKELQK